jgi:hypothetical protein
MADVVPHAVYLVNLGRIAAFPVLDAAAMNSVREHDRRPAPREVPLAYPPGAPGG